MAHCRWLALLCFLASVPWASSATAEWNRFRGPNGTGLSDATTVPINWTDRDYNWKVELPGEGHGSPVVFGERIFVTCADAKTAERRIACLSTRDGSVLWRQDYPSHTYKQHRANGYATATPAVDADGVVVTWATPEEVVLLALAHDGREMWRRDLGPFIGPHGVGSSPILVDDLVVLTNEQEDYRVLARLMGREATGPAGESFLIAVERKTGETKWKVPRKSTLAPYSTPCIHKQANGSSELIFTSTSYGITAIDAATGTVNWEIPDVFEDRCVGSPIVASGLVIASYGHGVTGRLCLAARPGSSLLQREPSIAYKITRSVPLVPTPLAVGDRLFLWSDNGIVTCLDLAAGDLIWRERVSGNFFGSPVCVANRLYCIAKNGEVVVLAAGDRFEELARVALGEPSYSTPAVSEGVMFLRTSSHLFSLGGQRP